jgi:hypothetical protein
MQNQWSTGSSAALINRASEVQLVYLRYLAPVSARLHKCIYPHRQRVADEAANALQLGNMRVACICVCAKTKSTSILRAAL